MALVDNLVSYWAMDESSDGSGAVTRVDSHASNDLTDTNTTASGTGIISNGADFETSNNEVLSISDASQTGLDLTGDLSISMWVSFESLLSSSTDRFVIGKWGSAGNRGYALALYNNAGTYQMEWLISNNGTTISAGTPNLPAAPTTNQLYHWVLVYDASAGTTDYWVDNSSLTQTTGMHNSINNNAIDFQIGGMAAVASPRHDGIIDEVGIWNRTLTTDEVAELYNSGAGLAYPFTGGVAFKPPAHTLSLMGVG